MSRRGLVQAGAALVILGALLVRLGPEPFVAAVRSVGPGALLLATVVTAGTTVCAAWRWRLVSTALGLPLTLGAAVGRSWRAQFLNVALPGGVLGDVHRGVSHGRDGGAPAAGVRAVVWERSLGQLVAVGLTVLALTAGRAFALVGVTVIAGFAVVAALVLLLRVVPERWRAVLLDDLRRLWVGHRLVPVVVTSTLAALGHAAVFLLAVRLTSPELPLLPLLPVALLVLVAAALPVNLAGWGPREGAAAWAFAAAGLPAAAGLEASVAFGVLSLVATWPGAVLLLAGRRTPAARGGTSVPPIPSSPEEMSRA